MRIPAILYDAIMRAQAQGVDPLAIAAVCYQESSCDPYVQDGDSGYSHGPMQLYRRGAGAGYSVAQLRHVEDNVRIGAAYLRSKLEQYPGDLARAFTAYNGPSLAADPYTGPSSYGKATLSHYQRFQQEGIERDPPGGPDPTDLEIIDAIWGSLGPAEDLERDLLLLLKRRLLPWL